MADAKYWLDLARMFENVCDHDNYGRALRQSAFYHDLARKEGVAYLNEIGAK